MVHARASCLAGGTATVERSVNNGQMQTFRLVVEPGRMWPTGYAYVVEFSGVGVDVPEWSVEHAELQPRSQQASAWSQGQTQIREFVFHPDAHAPSFAFNAQGQTLSVTSLSCRHYLPPPSQPTPSPPPPGPPPPNLFVLTKGVNSVASRSAVGVLTVLAFVTLCIHFSRLSRGRKLRQMLGLPPVPSNAIEGQAVLASDAACSAGGQHLNAAAMAAEEGDNCWSVIFLVGTDPIDLPLPKNVAASPAELKLAIAELACEVLDEQLLPPEWQRQNYSTMVIQYMDDSGIPIAMRPSTNYEALCNSDTLRVRRRTRSKS